MNNEIVPGFDDEKNESIRMRLQKTEEVEGCLIVHAAGYIDIYNTEFFRKRMEKAIESGFVRIVIEMSRVTYVSSTGIGAFVSLLRTVKHGNGDLVLNHVQPKVYEIFRLLGFSQFFAFMENLEESIAHFSQSFESPEFSTAFRCPICSKMLKASRVGRFRCGECKTILVNDEATSVMVVR
jgi:anti-sigma B factor antagonist